VPTGCGKACKRVDACFSIENSCWSPGFIMLTECPIHAGWKNLITVMASLSLSHYEVYFAFTNSTKLNEIIEEKTDIQRKYFSKIIAGNMQQECLHTTFLLFYLENIYEIMPTS
jgi:hypothetical protein